MKTKLFYSAYSLSQSVYSVLHVVLLIKSMEHGILLKMLLSTNLTMGQYGYQAWV